MNNRFYSEDIIVWNGVITRFGIVKPFLCGTDNVRMASKLEAQHYYEYQ